MSRTEYTQFIYNHINDLNYTDRKTIGQLLYKNDIKITEKPDGSQFNFDDINNTLLTEIYDFIQSKFKMEYPF